MQEGICSGEKHLKIYKGLQVKMGVCLLLPKCKTKQKMHLKQVEMPLQVQLWQTDWKNCITRESRRYLHRYWKE